MTIKTTQDKEKNSAQNIMRGLPIGRLIDLWVGAPALFILGLFRAKRKKPAKVEKIGILQTAAIGDTLLMSAAVKRIRLAYPQAEIILFCGTSNKAAGRMMPAINRMETINVFRFVDALKTLRSHDLDILVDFGPWPRINALLSYFSGAKFTLGYKTPKQLRHFAYDEIVDHRNDRHEIENQISLANLLLQEPQTEQASSVKAEIIFDPEQGEAATILPKPYVVFHPWASGSGKRRKEWPADHWADLTDWAHRHDFHVLLSGGPTDSEDGENLKAHILNKYPHVNISNGAGQYNLDQLCHILKNAAMVVSVNTGILHMAAILDAPVIGLHGPTNKERWGPVGEKIVGALDCGEGAGYLNLGFEFPLLNKPCGTMQRLLPAQVIEKWQAYINQNTAHDLQQEKQLKEI